MKKINLLLFTLLTAMQCSAYPQYGGGSITYTNLGGNQYLLQLAVYVDCKGDPAPLSVILGLTSNCGHNFTVAAAQTGISSFTDTICSSAATTCQGGNAPGFQKVLYSDTVALPACADWII